MRILLKTNLISVWDKYLWDKYIILSSAKFPSQVLIYYHYCSGLENTFYLFKFLINNGRKKKRCQLGKTFKYSFEILDQLSLRTPEFLIKPNGTLLTQFIPSILLSYLYSLNGKIYNMK